MNRCLRAAPMGTCSYSGVALLCCFECLKTGCIIAQEDGLQALIQACYGLQNQGAFSRSETSDDILADLILMVGSSNAYADSRVL